MDGLWIYKQIQPIPLFIISYLKAKLGLQALLFCFYYNVTQKYIKENIILLLRNL